MGLLGDLYSTIDSKKRQLRGLLSDPVETLYQGVRNFGAEQQGLLDMQARAYPWTGMDRNAVPDLAARKALADAGAAQGMAAATVWHGSPHKFDKFDSSKIGTGEGAQAYGHGLYLAESPEVAKSYKDVLAGADKVYMVGGKQVDPRFMDAFESNALQQIAAGRTTASALDDLAVQGVGESALSKMKPLLERFEKAGVKVSEVGKGSLYKVNLPDEHISKMLDWDKPLSQQPKEVQKALANPVVSDAIQKLKQSGQLGDYSAADLQKLRGEDYYDMLRQSHGDSNIAPSAFLQSQGIPGIRYLDGGSRGAGQGSSNFVVFPGNEGLLKILERNGK